MPCLRGGERFAALPAAFVNGFAGRALRLEREHLRVRLHLIAGASARGGDSSGFDQSIEVYDPQLRTWSVWTEDFGMDPAHLRAFEHRGRILLVSTQFPDPAAIELVWLDPSAASSP